MGENTLFFIGPSIWNKTPKVLNNNNINTFKHNFKKYYLTQLKQAENKLWSYYHNYYNYHFAIYLFVIIIIINYHQYYLLYLLTTISTTSQFILFLFTNCFTVFKAFTNSFFDFLIVSIFLETTMKIKHLLCFVLYFNYF